MKIKPRNLLIQLINLCNRKSIDQQTAFQSFITGGITALAGIGTLLLLGTNELTLYQEILALLALLLAGGGILIAFFSYILLLILRIGQQALPQEDKN